MDARPGVHHARNGDAGAAVARHLGEATRRNADAVERHGAAAGLAHEAEHIAAEPAGFGRNNRQHRLGADHSVHRAAIGTEQFLSGGGGERVGGRNGAGAAGEHGTRPRGEGVGDQIAHG